MEGTLESWLNVTSVIHSLVKMEVNVSSPGSRNTNVSVLQVIIIHDLSVILFGV